MAATTHEGSSTAILPILFVPNACRRSWHVADIERQIKDIQAQKRSLDTENDGERVSFGVL